MKTENISGPPPPLSHPRGGAVFILVVATPIEGHPANILHNKMMSSPPPYGHCAGCEFGVALGFRACQANSGRVSDTSGSLQETPVASSFSCSVFGFRQFDSPA